MCSALSPGTCTRGAPVLASVEKRVHAGKITWLVRWRDPAGRPHKKSFARKVDAERYRTAMGHDLLTGSYVDPARSRVRVGEWAQRWLATQVQVKPSTPRPVRGHRAKPNFPCWVMVPLVSIGHADIADCIAQLASAGLAPATVRQVHRVLSLILDLAVRDGRLPRNPADNVPLPRATRHEPKFLTRPQVAALAAAAGDGGLIVDVLALTGIRYGELAARR